MIEFSIVQFTIQANFLAIILEVCFLGFLLLTSGMDRRIHRFFIAYACVSLLLTVTDAIDFADSYLLTHWNILRNITSAAGYGFQPFIAIFITAISRRRIWKHVPVAYMIPAFFNLLISFMSIITGDVFLFHAANDFDRGYLSSLYFITSFGYLFLTAFFTFIDYRGKDGEKFIILLCIGIIITASMMEVLLDFRFFTNAAIAISGIMYYLFFTTYTFKRDSLTGVLNRPCFFTDLEKYGKESFAVISMDLNGLKDINDTFGHAEGDRALLTVSQLIKSSMSGSSQLYRTGGDEFMMIMRNVHSENIEQLLLDIRQAVDNSNYSLAIGYDIYTPGMDITEVRKNSDAMMYKNKAEIKRIKNMGEVR